MPGKRSDGEGKGLQPLDVGFHLLSTKKGLRGEIERTDRVYRSEFGLVDLGMFQTDGSLVL